MVFTTIGTQIHSTSGNINASFMIAGGVLLLFIISIELHTHGGWRFGIVYLMTHE
ncbi:MAG TPA: hypothetical protein VLE21_04345 [Candidatus Nitrosocosmicus sp.]|nr:hypothetical protein [Candidatus Nitrosocosmicus sp.]